MFEIIDTVKSLDSHQMKVEYTSQDTSDTWQRVAWGFLKLVGANEHLNIEKKIRLQLFYSQTKYKKQSNESMVPEIYYLYKNGPRLKYPASLHVTVKSILPPSSFEPGIRSLYSLNENHRQTNLGNKNQESKDDNQFTSNNEINTSPRQNAENTSQTKTIWSRVAGLPCRVPNEKILKLSSTKNGCYSVKFSSTGNYLGKLI